MRAGILFLICFCLIPVTSQAAAIHDAAKKGDIVAIAAALDAGANVNESDGLAAPLNYAVNRQHLDAAKLLIERGGDVNAVSKLGGAPLMAAVKEPAGIHHAAVGAWRRSERDRGKAGPPPCGDQEGLPRLRDRAG